MKKIEAVVEPFELEELKRRLADVRGRGIIISEVPGFGRQKATPQASGGGQCTGGFVPKVKVEVLAPEERVAAVIDTIEHAARTGVIGDGTVFVATVD